MAGRTARATSDAKRATEELNAMDEGDEVGISTPDSYYRGTVERTLDERPPAANVAVTTDEHEIIVTSEFDGPDDAAHIDTDPEQFTVTVSVDGGVAEYPVESIVNWDNGLEAPDETITEVGDEQDDIEAEMEQAVDKADEVIYELLHMKVIFKQVLRGEITFAEMEEAMIELEAEQGGTLSVDDHW